MSSLSFVTLLCVLMPGAPASDRPPRLSSEELKQPLIWASECVSPEGVTLGFGGQDQQADDGGGRTRLKINGKWQSISAELWAKHPQREWHAELEQHRAELRAVRQIVRQAWFDDTADFAVQQPQLVERVLAVRLKLVAAMAGNNIVSGNVHSPILRRANHLFSAVGNQLLTFENAANKLPQQIEALSAAIVALEELTGLFGAEPPPRALAPLVYDAASKRFVLFGGDHCDYLTNDLWLFDPVARTWEVRVVENNELAPPPRANHTITAVGDGTVNITGGYKYTSSTDYCGGQYENHDRELSWSYNIASNRWTAPQNAVPSARTREYRTGPYDPAFFLTPEKAPRPSRAATAEFLKNLPENTWTAMQPSALPQLNRDWGTAILDPQRDLILRFSGGHSAHGGSDVLHYHLATNRWELTQPVEFPLGQLYTNTEYPDGFNFNRRPWVTGHTYQNYGYAPGLGEMVFAGRETHSYFYDPTLGDWLPRRTPKPLGMLYGSCFYTLTLTSSPEALFCWTQEGRLFEFEAGYRNWKERTLQGDKLDGAVVDNSTIAHDARRGRLLCCRKPYGDKHVYAGAWQAIDLATNTVSAVVPENAPAAAGISYLCQIRVHPEHDLLLCGCTLPPGGDGIRRTPAFDLAKNRWVSMRLTGDDPHGPKGRNVSLGLVYDARRQLFWAVDAASRVFVLRLNPAAADMKAL